MEETRHTHHYPAGRGGPIDTRPSLTHDHDRGLDGHDHDEEIEVVIGRLLVKRNYTGLTPRAQRIVAIGIAAMRQACFDVHRLVDETSRRYPPPSTSELRAPLVTRVKGERQPPPLAVPTSHARCTVCGGTTWQRLDADGKPHGPAALRHEKVDGRTCPEKLAADARAAGADAADVLAARQLDRGRRDPEGGAW